MNFGIFSDGRCVAVNENPIGTACPARGAGCGAAFQKDHAQTTIQLKRDVIALIPSRLKAGSR
jgi:hypothetical protein